ncbi:hypothetical protein A2U01_0098028, partial [Trifolium medium]|nr:hypothetical protein [Trifolium medium]
VEVEPVVVAKPSAVARLASSPYVVFLPAPAALGTGDAWPAAVATSPAAVATSEPTCYL